MTVIENPALAAALIEQERDILARIARGGPLSDVLRDLILLVERPSDGEMVASILFVSPDGNHLLEGAAPSLPAEYNAAINGIEIGPAVGSCGTAAFCGQPVYVTDIATDPLWTDFRDLALRHGLRACWSEPIRGEDGKVLGTFANYYREPRAPNDRDKQVIQMVAQTAAIAIERHRRDLERTRAEEQRALLLRELNHRVKNVFAITNSLLVMTARNSANPTSLVEAVQGRLQALSRAHELVQPGFAGPDDQAQCSVSLDHIIRDILAPYAIHNMTERVRIEGPDIGMTADAVTPIALIVHELATNAAKYGALSVGHGAVNISWSIAGDNLVLDWIETGGPKPLPPSRTGFGSTLTKRSVEGQLGGKIQYDWREAGLAVRITLPLRAITPGH
jgi:two-component sensor histidine kinase